MNSFANLMTIFEEYLCYENCRACGQYCRAHRGLYARIKAVCSSCWPSIISQTPLCQVHNTPNGTFPIVSAARYQGALKKLIYKFKYDADLLLAGDLAELLMAGWGELQDSLYSDSRVPEPIVLVPIPLHPKRLKSRGFNQSELLAQEISRLVRVPVSAAALKRVKNTQAQHDLGKAERVLNLSGAFAGNQLKLSGKTVILIDDIYTTGVTMAEAAQEALSCGAARVMALTIACVDFSPD